MYVIKSLWIEAAGDISGIDAKFGKIIFVINSDTWCLLLYQHVSYCLSERFTILTLRFLLYLLISLLIKTFSSSDTQNNVNNGFTFFFFIMISCSVTEGYQHFGPEDGGSMFFTNVHNHLPDLTVSYPRKPQYGSSLLIIKYTASVTLVK